MVTSYPGSPTPEIAEGIRSIPNNPMYFEFSVNEKVATEVAFGAAMNGHLSTVFFKSVGINVAADSFVQLGLFDLKGGMVVVLGMIQEQIPHKMNRIIDIFQNFHIYQCLSQILLKKSMKCLKKQLKLLKKNICQ
ncbi:hypothetical protein [Marinitoga lauensis]|uniref:hypothetical protein n=1 Tax=Marinitoga lauensis TaxID=2201189 RepID=UPI00197F58AE|nr:hypothetical protein [Marinitoga lauensis]